MIAPEDRVFDRVKFHPETNRAFAFQPRTVSGVTYKYWYNPLTLDQGQEGACVAFADSGELSSSPVRVKNITNATALDLYHKVQATDRAMGNNFGSGASTLAGMKTLQALGYITEYRWGFTLDAIRSALLTEGPVVIGIEWLDGMYYTDPNGRVQVSGSVVGGHEIVLDGWAKARKLTGESKAYEYFRWKNSWGNSYGKGGHGFIRAEDLQTLMDADGEAVIPMGRKQISL